MSRGGTTALPLLQNSCLPLGWTLVPFAFGLNRTWLSQKERLSVLGEPDTVVQENLHHDRGPKGDVREHASRDRHERI